MLFPELTRPLLSGRIGGIGFSEKEDLSVLKKKEPFVHYVEHFRIPADEIAQV